MGRQASIENAPWSAFLIRMVSLNLIAFLGIGYVFGALAIVMGSVTTDYEISAGWKGLITAGALMGIFVGALVGSWIADKAGRRGILMFTLLAVAAGSFAYLAVSDKVWFLVVRVVIGLGLGAILSIVPPLLSEFTPVKRRGALLSNLNVVWFIGFLLAYYLAIWMSDAGVSWKWILVTAFVPMLVAFVLSLGAPESIRWLLTKGRVEEARALVKRHYGESYDVNDLMGEEDKRASYRVLFSRQYRARTAFSMIFYTAQVTVFFAVYLFLPNVLDALGLGAGTGTDLLVNILTLAAMVGGVWVCQKLPRRPWVIWSFWVGAVASVALGVGAGSLPTWSILVLFLVFIVVTNAASNLEFVYPPELFPTEVRSSGQGITVATARIGSVLSTWVLPSLLLTVGISWTMIILGGVSAVGAIASHLWAPETQGLSLLEASGAKETSGSSSRLGSSEVLQGAGVVSRD